MNGIAIRIQNRLQQTVISGIPFRLEELIFWNRRAILHVPQFSRRSVFLRNDKQIFRPGVLTDRFQSSDERERNCHQRPEKHQRHPRQ